MEKNINEIAQQKRREYMKDWRKKNRERVRHYNENYWLRKAEESHKSGEQEE